MPKNALLYGALVVLVILTSRHNLSGAFVNLAFFVGVLFTMIVVHELGHAIAAVLVRARLLEISIGSGRPLVTRRILGCRVCLRLDIVGGGHVKTASTRSQWFRSRLCCLLLAGVGAECLAVLVLWQLRPYHERLAWLAAAAAIVTAINAIANLVPDTVHDGVRNDGGQVLDTLRMTDGDVRQVVRSAET